MMRICFFWFFPWVALAQFTVQSISTDRSPHPQILILGVEHKAPGITADHERTIMKSHQQANLFLNRTFETAKEPMVILIEGTDYMEFGDKSGTGFSGAIFPAIVNANILQRATLRGAENIFLNLAGEPLVRHISRGQYQSQIEYENIHFAFWLLGRLRSFFMAQSILKARAEYPGARIVLVTGIFHGFDGVLTGVLKEQSLTFQIAGEDKHLKPALAFYRRDSKEKLSAFGPEDAPAFLRHYAQQLLDYASQAQRVVHPVHSGNNFGKNAAAEFIQHAESCVQSVVKLSFK